MRREEYTKEKVSKHNKQQSTSSQNHRATSYDGHYLMPAAHIAIQSSYCSPGNIFINCDCGLQISLLLSPDKRRSNFNNRRGRFSLPSGIESMYQTFIIMVTVTKKQKKNMQLSLWNGHGLVRFRNKQKLLGQFQGIIMMCTSKSGISIVMVTIINTVQITEGSTMYLFQTRTFQCQSHVSKHYITRISPLGCNTLLAHMTYKVVVF